MSFIAWIVLGLIAGFIGNKLVNKKGKGILGNLIVGVVGALFGGFLFDLFGANGVTGLNLWSILVAVVGAVVLLAGYNAFRRERKD
jgi:uncharacterized membrane protein YeaQ/YmgE (transglycosylase-associated protein family)